MLASKLALTVLLVALGSALANPVENRDRGEWDSKFKLIVFSKLQGKNAPTLDVYAIKSGKYEKEGFPVVTLANVQPGKSESIVVDLRKYGVIYFVIKNFTVAVLSKAFDKIRNVNYPPNQLKVIGLLREGDGYDVISRYEFKEGERPY